MSKPKLRIVKRESSISNYHSYVVQEFKIKQWVDHSGVKHSTIKGAEGEVDRILNGVPADEVVKEY